MTIQKTCVSTSPMTAVTLCLAAFATQTVAQTAVQPTPQEVDVAFRAVVANAGSIEARSRYATLLVQAGNFEGGIAALEGMLLSPDAPASVRVELAVLYYRLGSYASSEAYLRAALADPRLDASQKTGAETLLRDVVQRNRRSQLTGSVVLGLRSQSNPTAATDSGQVLYQGISVPRAPDGAPKSDVDANIWAKLDHVLDLDQQNEASVVSSLVAYANHYSSVSSYTAQPGNTKPFDLTVLAASTGIRFKPAPSTSPQLTLRPHLVFGGATANGNNFFTTSGIGIDSDYRVSETMLLAATYVRSNLSFANRSDIANSAQQGGNRQVLRLQGTVETGPNRFLMAELGYVDHDGNAVYTAYRGPELRFAYALSYPPPMLSVGLPWTTTVSASALRRDYRGADPVVDSTTIRQDTEWRLSLVNAIPLSRDVGLQLQLDYTKMPSTLPNYSFTNTSGALGVIWKY